MRVAAIYDIHGNLPALEAVLDDVRRADVDRIVVGGDVVPGPMPRETIDALLALDTPLHCLRGNGDREVVARMRGIETGTVPVKFRPVMSWVAQQLASEHERLLAAWPETLRMDVEGIGAVLFCHATPRSDTEIFTRLTADDRLRPAFGGAKASLVVCGHTHMQFDRTLGPLRIVNAGSVGMPFGQPGAYWLEIDVGQVRFRRTTYDLAAAAARIRRSGYPQADEFAEQNVLHPPSEEAMLGAFGAAELGQGS
jgi:putative phosphoesterase